MSDGQRFIQMLGFELDREAPDGPTICVNVGPGHKNGNGVVHGSVIHALIDTVMGMQCFRAAGRRPVATAEISVRFLRAVFDGRLVARAKVLRAGKRLLFVEADVRRGDEVVAVGQATFVPVAAERQDRDPGSASK